MVGNPADRSRPVGPRRGVGVREVTRRRRVLESSDVAVSLVVMDAADAGLPSGLAGGWMDQMWGR
jgi:hypothetical protein